MAIIAPRDARRIQGATGSGGTDAGNVGGDDRRASGDDCAVGDGGPTHPQDGGETAYVDCRAEALERAEAAPACKEVEVHETIDERDKAMIAAVYAQEHRPEHR